jgi:hypothetical protein
MKLRKEMIFFIYLIERYAQARQRRAGEVLQQWDMLGLTQFIYDMYDMYHIERIENAFDDIDNLVLEKCS